MKDAGVRDAVIGILIENNQVFRLIYCACMYVCEYPNHRFFFLSSYRSPSYTHPIWESTRASWSYSEGERSTKSFSLSRYIKSNARYLSIQRTFLFTYIHVQKGIMYVMYVYKGMYVYIYIHIYMSELKWVPMILISFSKLQYRFFVMYIQCNYIYVCVCTSGFILSDVREL